MNIYSPSTPRHLIFPSLFLLFFLALSSLVVCAQEGVPRRHRLVNPFVGTAGGGNTYPGASVPFGLVQLSPDVGLSGWYRISGYAYTDSTIASFSHTHLSGTGAGDFYDVAFLPYVGEMLQSPQMPVPYATFSHDTEQAHAGYYAVTLWPDNIRAELTASTHCGVQRYTYPLEASEYRVFLDLARAFNWDRTQESQISQVDDYTIEGYRLSSGWAPRQYVYFRTRFSLPIRSIRIEESPSVSDGSSSPTHRLCRAYIAFAPTADRQLTLLTAIQPDPSGFCAESMLQYECGGRTFDQIKQAAESQWDTYLGYIEVARPLLQGIDTTFYTSLYHTALGPIRFDDSPSMSLFSGITPERILSQQSASTCGGDERAVPHKRRYTNFSLWDTYRAVHPLFNLIIPVLSAEMTASLVESMGSDERMDDTVLLPRWPLWGLETGMMIGFHSASVIADTYIKGLETRIPDDLVQMLIGGIDLEALSPIAYQSHRQKEVYLSQMYGYVPADSLDQSVSHTLELAYTDACQARLLEQIAPEEQPVIDRVRHRASHYQHVYDHESGFFRPRLSDGSFREPFCPFSYTADYTESNAYQYLFSVQHDIPGLCKLLGGRAQMAQRLDELFDTVTPDTVTLPVFATGMIGQYNHGNEPVHHVPYLYNYVNEPWKTADMVRRISLSLYHNGPDGLCGNEDYGQMSAWYVFSAMGFYPLDPTSGRYELGSPLFGQVTLRSEVAGKPFRLIAHGLSERHRYIKTVTIDGKPWAHSYITYQHIKDGSTVELQMTDQVGEVWY